MGSKAKDRYDAIQCLELILVMMLDSGTSSSEHVNTISSLIPYKGVVTKKLKLCFEDNKQAIRLYAVKVRNKYLLSL